MRTTRILRPGEGIKFTPYETARNFATYHRGQHEYSDAACVAGHLAAFVRCGYLTESEGDELARFGVYSQERLI